ncbi:MAG TPA: GNAT family N-acetyltransferase [Trebonia sp.]
MDEIMELERAAALHWRGVEEQALGEWALRAAEGFTGRANSVLPGGDPGLPLDQALAAVTSWYRSRGLPPMIQVAMPLDGAPGPDGPGQQDEPGPGERDLDAELERRGWGIRSGDAFMMTATPATVRENCRDSSGNRELRPEGPGLRVRVDGELTPEWLAMHRYRGQSELPPVRMKVLTSAPEQVFVSLVTGETGGDGDRDDGDRVVAVARLSFGGGWAGITSVEVDPAYRRRGLGSALTAACCEHAFASGVKRVFLQVETGNEAARALYERCGFGYAHRYQYRVLPA